jgi:ABC-type antimicrobial peptide transport system permease subunit
MTSSTSNKEWLKPNLQVIVPYTFFQGVFTDWSSKIRQFLVSFRDGTDIEKTAKGVRSFFEQRYGKSGEFREGFDSVMITQMKKFLTLFTVMLSSIAIICLSVGGIGIANMMLVSVSERIKEIGLRKAIGATDADIRNQLLLESTFLCVAAGVIGLVAGFVIYQGVIFAVSKFMPKVPFEWVVEWTALILSMFSIVAVGILSGMVPALKAQRLQIVEALRTE